MAQHSTSGLNVHVPPSATHLHRRRRGAGRAAVRGRPAGVEVGGQRQRAVSSCRCGGSRVGTARPAQRRLAAAAAQRGGSSGMALTVRAVAGVARGSRCTPRRAGSTRPGWLPPGALRHGRGRGMGRQRRAAQDGGGGVRYARQAAWHGAPHRAHLPATTTAAHRWRSFRAGTHCRPGHNWMASCRCGRCSIGRCALVGCPGSPRAVV